MQYLVEKVLILADKYALGHEPVLFLSDKYTLGSKPMLFRSDKYTLGHETVVFLADTHYSRIRTTAQLRKTMCDGGGSYPLGYILCIKSVLFSRFNAAIISFFAEFSYQKKNCRWLVFSSVVFAVYTRSSV